MNMLHYGHFMQYQKLLTHAIAVFWAAVSCLRRGLRAEVRDNSFNLGESCTKQIVGRFARSCGTRRLRVTGKFDGNPF
jgi:hypothetical protein